MTAREEHEASYKAMLQEKAQIEAMNVSVARYAAVAEVSPRTWFGADVAPYIRHGEKLIAQIAFWGELPLIGALMQSRLADQLDRLTDKIEPMAG